MAEPTVVVTTTTNVVLLLLLLRLPTTTCKLVKCDRAELSACYCGKTTYDRQELYAVNCTGTGLSKENSLDALMNLPNETEVRR